MTVLDLALGGSSALLPIVVGAKAYVNGKREGKRLSRPVCKYEVLTIPVKKFNAPVELTPTANLLARYLRKQNIVICEAVTDAYSVIIRNTVDGWHKEYGWDDSYWAKFNDKIDTEIGTVAVSDPEFHEKILKLQDEAQNKAALLEIIT